MKNKLTATLFSIVILAVSLSLAGGIRQADDPGVLLRAAIEKEEVDGDLQGAIDLYKQIIASHGSNRAIAAKAQLRIGMCFEKLGLREAQKAYQQVIDNYPDQADAIKIAKERIAILSKEPDIGLHKPMFRKIQIPTKIEGHLSLSPDGQKISLSSPLDGKLWIMPLSGKLGPEFPGEPVELDTGDVGVEWSAHNWSGDGKWIAFNEDVQVEELQKKEKKGIQGIYVVSSEGGIPRKVYENYRDARVINYRISLSPDGKTLAFSSIDLDKNEQHIYTIPVEDGKPKRLVDVQAREPVFAPDGEMIAYVEDKNLGVGGGSLWVVPAQGGNPKLMAEAKKASSPVWSPEGDMIAFVDKQDKAAQIHFIIVGEDGETSRKKISVSAPEGIRSVDLLTGWTPDNKIGAVLEKPLEFGLYTVSAEGGKATMVSHGGYPVQPRFSPDGKRIYHVNNAVAGSGAWQRLGIAFVPAEGGEVKVLPLDREEKMTIPAYGAGNSISPDGKMILFAENYGKHIWSLPVEGGKPNQITKAPESFADLYPCCSPDGNAVAFIRTRVSKNYAERFQDTNIFIVDSKGGEPKSLTTESDRVSFSPIAWSPDGKTLAYYSLGSSINIIPAVGGKSQVVCQVQANNVNTELAWSPDSKRIAFNTWLPAINETGIKVLSLEDGNVVDIKTDLADTSIYHLDWSPDGKKLVFGGYKGGGREFWLMEDFLPLLRSGTK
jgi:Tol biopolymer transport system component